MSEKMSYLSEGCEPIFTQESHDGTGPTGLLVSSQLMEFGGQMSEFASNVLTGQLGHTPRTFVIMDEAEYQKWRKHWQKANYFIHIETGELMEK